MGAVYQGLRVADGRPVAIKLLATDLAEKPTARARFLNEATLNARVPHPHVVAVTDSGEESSRVYLVMDLLEGEDLARRLQRTGPMSVGEAIEVLAPICDALASAHGAGVIHRDLKPSNIFLAVREGRQHPMLLDFGVATDEDASGERDKTGEGDRALTWNGVGTPMYLAPELVRDHRAAGPASDQYALGAILYETLTGEPPYAADNLRQLLQTIAAGSPPSARARRPELRPKVDAVVLRAMSADPQGRFPSVEDLGRALREFASSPDTPEPFGRRPPSSPAIAMEAATPSPFVRTLVPEHEAKSGPWFVAPDAEISEDEHDWFESDVPAADPVGLGEKPEESPRLDDGGGGVKDEGPGIEAAAAPRMQAEGPASVASSPEEDPASTRARTLPSVDWQAATAFASKHRRILLLSGIALLGIVLLFAIRGGRTVSVPPATPPVAVEKAAPAAPAPPAAPAAPPAPEKAEPAPAAPPTPAALEKTEPAPVAPAPAPAALEKTATAHAAPAAGEDREVEPARPAAAPATAEKREVAPKPPVLSAAVSPPPEPSRERPKPAARRERPAPSRVEAPLPKVASPAPAPKPRAPESAPVRMHNGVPLLD
jgi:serine/threonine-protein kinase